MSEAVGFNEFEDETFEQITSDSVSFSMFVQYYAMKNSLNILDSILKIEEEYGIDPEKIKDLLTNNIKGLLEEDFIESGLIKKQNTLKDFFEK